MHWENGKNGGYKQEGEEVSKTVKNGGDEVTSKEKRLARRGIGEKMLLARRIGYKQEGEEVTSKEKNGSD